VPSEQHEQMVREYLPAVAAPPGSTVPEMREHYARLSRDVPLPEDVVVESVGLQVRSEWIAIRGAAVSRRILYLHGGGYVFGSIDTHREFAGRLARAAAARVLQIDYRLAPENPFPAGLDDALAAYEWLLGEGIDPARIAIGGDSAGGALALALAMRLRDEGRPLPAAVICICPFLDLTASGASVEANAEADPLVKPAAIHRTADFYAPNDKTHPYASPLFGDFRGLPPLLLTAGTCETLLDDSIRAADRARAAGTDVELFVEEGMTHVWPIRPVDMPESRIALARIRAFLDRVAG